MKSRSLSLFIIFIGFAITVTSQSQKDLVDSVVSQEAQDTVLVNNLLQQSKENLNESPDKAIALATQAKDLADKIHFKKGVAYGYKNIGLAYLNQAKYIEALQNYEQSLKIFKKIKYDEGIANLLGNIGVIYYYQGDMVKALDYYLKSLKIAEQTGNKLRIVTMLNNVGAIYGIKDATFDKALQYYLQALPLCEELGDKDALGGVSVNIGDIYFQQGNNEKALYYLNNALKAYGPNSEGSPNAYNAIGTLYLKQNNYDLALKNHSEALDISEKLKDKLKMVQSLMGIAKVYMQQKDYKSALNYFRKAEQPSLEVNSSNILVEVYKNMSEAYAKSKDFVNAFKYQSLYSNEKDTVYNNEADKKLTSLQFDFDLEKKQGEINLLTKDQALTKQKLKAQQFAKRAAIIGLTLSLMIALLIYRFYRIKAKTNKILDKQKDQIEGLLLNILPAEVARELQVKGHATPRNYESVAVMFTDFRGFTTIADKMSPQDLIEELNECFIAFDEIMDKYSLEKIKTIGDAYMCAGGIPTPTENYVDNIIKASLEIRNFALQYNKKRIEAGMESWDLRIGIHVGPVVAGVVGKKKYAYDIWGSTVNIASRMESNGIPGQVNISAFTYELIKDKYACHYRGKIHAKNIGEIDMYLIEGEAQADEVNVPSLAQAVKAAS